MVFREFSMVIVLVVVGIAAAAAVISSCFLGPDNPVEESAEAVIKEQTGLDLDLSPSSPEK